MCRCRARACACAKGAWRARHAGIRLYARARPLFQALMFRAPRQNAAFTGGAPARRPHIWKGWFCMELIRLTGTEDERYERAMGLYRASFPPHEQRSAAAQAMALRDKDYHFGLVYDGGVFAGLLLYWEAPAQKGSPACRAAQGFLYVEHFCILPELRGMGCGDRPAGRCHCRAQKGLLRALRLCGEPIPAHAPALSPGKRGPCAGGDVVARHPFAEGIQRVCAVFAAPRDGRRAFVTRPGRAGQGPCRADAVLGGRRAGWTPHRVNAAPGRCRTGWMPCRVDTMPKERGKHGVRRAWRFAEFSDILMLSCGMQGERI